MDWSYSLSNIWTCVFGRRWERTLKTLSEQRPMAMAHVMNTSELSVANDRLTPLLVIQRG